MIACWNSGIRENTRCKVMPVDVSSTDGDRANEFRICLRKGQDTHTAKGFPATLVSSDDILRFLLFPELCSTSSLAGAVPALFTRFVVSCHMDRSVRVTLASYSHVPYLLHDVHITHTILHFVWYRLISLRSWFRGRAISAALNHKWDDLHEHSTRSKRDNLPKVSIYFTFPITDIKIRAIALPMVVFQMGTITITYE